MKIQKMNVLDSGLSKKEWEDMPNILANNKKKVEQSLSDLSDLIEGKTLSKGQLLMINGFYLALIDEIDGALPFIIEE